MISDYHSHGYEVVPVIWTRGIEGEDDFGSIQYRSKGLISGRFKNLLFFLKWHAFIAKLLWSKRNQDFIIHCVDLDTALVCVPFGALLRKKIVYDAFDHFASSRDLKGPLYTLGWWLEHYLFRLASIRILPDRARMAQYGIQPTMRSAANVCIISNVPTATQAAAAEEVFEKNTTGHGEGSPLRLCYVGTLEAKHRGLEYIPELCSELGSNIHFTVAGNGELENFFIEQARKLPNLTFNGYVSYEKGLSLMYGADMIYGPYLLSSKNHEYASPNKMFEHTLLGKALITNTGTPVSNFVAENQTGYLFDGSYNDLKRLIVSLEKEEIRKIGVAARTLWVNKLKDLRNEQIHSFLQMVQS